MKINEKSLLSLKMREIQLSYLKKIGAGLGVQEEIWKMTKVSPRLEGFFEDYCEL